MSTKRFISATRAEGVRCANVSAFLAVRNFEKDCSLCVQAANKASRSAAVGASGAFVTAAAGPAFAAELDSCAANDEVDSNINPPQTVTAKSAHRATSVLCRGKNSCQILRERRAWHYLIASRRARLRCQVRLYVRQETDYPHSILLRSQPLNHSDGLTTRIQVHDQQSRRR